MEDEFESGGQTVMESDHMTFAELAKHCKETRYCEAQFDSEGRKIIGVRGKDTIDSHIKALEEYFGSDKLRDIRVANLRAYRKHRLFCKNRHGKLLSVATVNRELSTMRAMLNEAERDLSMTTGNASVGKIEKAMEVTESAIPSDAPLLRGVVNWPKITAVDAHRDIATNATTQYTVEITTYSQMRLP